MKKAFTLSEALITIAIIGIISAIIVPSISNSKPDKDKITYKKAMYSLTTAVNRVLEDNPSADTLANITNLCTEISNNLNISGAVNCGSSSYASPNFVTTDGIRFWSVNGDMPISSYKVIFIDRKLTDNEIKARFFRLKSLKYELYQNCNGNSATYTPDACKGLKIRLYPNGRIANPDADYYKYENSLMENSMNVKEE